MKIKITVFLAPPSRGVNPPPTLFLSNNDIDQAPVYINDLFCIFSLDPLYNIGQCFGKHFYFFFGSIGGRFKTRAQFAIDLYGDFHFLFFECMLIMRRPRFFVYRCFVSKNLPQFFREVRCKRSEELEKSPGWTDGAKLPKL